MDNNNNKFIYNNEAISMVALIAVLEKINNLNIAKAMLILPLLYYKRTLNFLNKKDTAKLSLEEFTNHKILLTNFNERFLTYLPITINSISILRELNIIKVSENNIKFIPNNKFDLNNTKLGERAGEIIKGATKISELLKEDTNNLYLQLNIIL